jgi:TonB family protein
VAHALSTSSYRSDHLSPSALALAVLLHAAVAAALWWMMLNRPSLPPAEEAIEVTIEQPKPPEPKPPPPKPEPPKQETAPKPPEPLGLMPEAAITAEKRTQVPTAPVRPNEAPAPSAPAQADRPQPFAFSPAPSPPPTPKPPTPQEAARAPTEPQTPFSSPLPAPTLPPPPPPAPPAHALAAPPLPRASPAPQRPDLHPAPPTPAPPRRPAAPAASESPSTSPFVNPADTYNRARVADNYLWQIARKLQGYRYEAHVNVSHGTTVVRVTIARDGRLLDVAVTGSSGVPEFDQGVLAGVRSGSPYDPLPPDIQGASATFTLPLVSVNRQ